MDSGVHRIKAISYGCDVYLDAPFVIDSGIDGKHVVKKIEEIGFNELDFLFLTHPHHDHIKGAKSLKEKFDLKVIGHSQLKKAIEEKNSSLMVSDKFGDDVDQFEVDIIVDDGEVMDGYKIMHTPGHSTGGISLIDKGKNCCFVGDLFFPQGRLGRTDLPTGNPKKMKKSIESVLKQDLDVFYTGHGGKATRTDLEKAYERIRDLDERSI